MSGIASFLWRNKYRLMGGAIIGVGAGVFFGRNYIASKIEDAAVDYQKQILKQMEKEEEEMFFEQVQLKCRDHTVKFLSALKQLLNNKLDPRPTLKLLETATKNKDQKRKMEHWKVILDIKLARTIAAAVGICVLNTNFRVQFTILHRESRALRGGNGSPAKAGQGPRFKELDEEGGEKDLSPDDRREFLERSFSTMTEDLNALAAKLLEVTTAATLNRGWHGEKFGGRITATEITGIVDDIVGSLKDDAGLYRVLLANEEERQTQTTPLIRRGSVFASADGANEIISSMLDEAQHMMSSPLFRQGLSGSVQQGVDALKGMIVADIADLSSAAANKSGKEDDKVADGGVKPAKIYLARAPFAMDRIRNRVFKSNASKNKIMEALEQTDKDELKDFCAALFHYEEELE